jgi:hypothetical protein
MTAPTPAVWAATKQRDNEQCVSCNARHSLTFQHRRAVGNGGSKIKPSIEDGLVACYLDNLSYEAEKQTVALAMGWKVRSWVKHPEDVPVFYFNEHQWYVLDTMGGRTPITSATALRMMRDVYGPSFTFEKGPVK